MMPVQHALAIKLVTVQGVKKVSYLIQLPAKQDVLLENSY